METIKLCENGDVLLVPGNAPMKRFLVSSVILCNSSSVFRAMFDGRFKEGQNVSATSPQAVYLEDDDPSSFEVLLRLLHYKPEPGANTFMTPQQSPAFAELCDKYDCVQPLEQVMKFWYRDLEERGASFDELIHMTATASILKDKDRYELYTRSLVMKYTGSFHAWIKREDRPLSVATLGESCLHFVGNSR